MNDRGKGSSPANQVLRSGVIRKFTPPHMMAMSNQVNVSGAIISTDVGEKMYRHIISIGTAPNAKDSKASNLTAIQYRREEKPHGPKIARRITCIMGVSFNNHPFKRGVVLQSSRCARGVFTSKRRSSCANVETLPLSGTRLGRPDSLRKIPEERWSTTH